MDAALNDIVQKLASLEPVSVFLYGSRARADFLDRSDYEIGVLYRRAQKISRTQLKELVGSPSVNAYPFEYEDFLDYKIDTPFPEAIYLRELIQGGKTIYGEKVIEQMQSPPIKVSHLLERVRFDTAFALAAVLSHRHGDMVTASMEFSKSCLFAVRSLIVLRSGEFPLAYDEIYEKALRLNLPSEYAEVIRHAMDVRKGAEPQEAYLYKNISMINKLIKEELQFEDASKILLQ